MLFIFFCIHGELSLVIVTCPSTTALTLVYSSTTVAPSSFIVATIFSASSLGTDSFMTLGALSTNFFESTKLNPSKLLISLMTLGFAAASNAVSFSVKRDFSAAAGGSSVASSAAAAAGAAAAGAAKPPTGRSGMLRRNCSIQGQSRHRPTGLTRPERSYLQA